MKKFTFISIVIALASFIPGYAQSDDSAQVLIDPTVVISDKGDVKVCLVTTGINVGWCTPTDASMDMDCSMMRSWEIGWPMIAGVDVTVGKTSSFTVGLGLDWRNFCTAGDHGFRVENDGTIDRVKYLYPDAEHKRSRIKIFSLQVPLIYSFAFGHNKDFRASIGAIINFNTSASVKTGYRIGDVDYSTKWRKPGQKPVTVDFMPMITYHKIGLYMRYSPMNMMKKETGLEFKPLSAGLIFAW